MKGIIRIGDPTSHGGKVTSGHEGYRVQGAAVARVGDTCTCPRPGHGGTCTIVEGHPRHLVDGVAVAVDGCSTSCGATLMTTLAEHSM
jgi:uncharacterized Zn-binding protein involved in type VI secretion